MNVIPPTPPDDDCDRPVPGTNAETLLNHGQSTPAADADGAIVLRAAEAGRNGTRAAALAVEVRTLRERLVVLRARAAALDQKVAAQAEDLEKYRHALGAAAEALRQQQNLAASYPLHAGAVLAERGRWLAAEYRARGLRGRLKLLPRLAEFLDAHARLAAAAQPPADWPAVLAELEAARAGGWRRLVFGPAAWRRSLRLLARHLRIAG